MNDRAVRLLPLGETGFSGLLPRIAFLKASADEAELVDVTEARRRCCVVVTRGEEGCRLYWGDAELTVPAFAARQVDPTGAGDCFLGGFIAGLAYGVNVGDAALLGNFFGSLAVRQIGLPTFRPRVLQAVREKLKQNMQGSSMCLPSLDNSLADVEPDVELRNFLTKVSKTACDDNDDHERSQEQEASWSSSDGAMVTLKENGCVNYFDS